MWASFEVMWFGSLGIGSICLEAPESGAIAISGGVDADVEVTIGAIRFIITSSANGFDLGRVSSEGEKRVCSH